MASCEWKSLRNLLLADITRYHAPRNHIVKGAICWTISSSTGATGDMFRTTYERTRVWQRGVPSIRVAPQVSGVASQRAFPAVAAPSEPLSRYKARTKRVLGTSVSGRALWSNGAARPLLQRTRGR